MGFGPTGLPPIHIPRDGEVVHRVTPNAETQDYGHKEQPNRRRKQKADSEHSPLHDTVDVSEEYWTTAPETEEEALPSEAEDTSVASARRLDIRV